MRFILGGAAIYVYRTKGNTVYRTYASEFVLVFVGIIAVPA